MFVAYEGGLEAFLPPQGSKKGMGVEPLTGLGAGRSRARMGCGTCSVSGGIICTSDNLVDVLVLIEYF